MIKVYNRSCTGCGSMVNVMRNDGKVPIREGFLCGDCVQKKQKEDKMFNTFRGSTEIGTQTFFIGYKRNPMVLPSRFMEE